MASIYDVCKNFLDFYPLLPRPQKGLMYVTSLFYALLPPPPQCGRRKWKPPKANFERGRAIAHGKTDDIYRGQLKGLVSFGLGLVSFVPADAYHFCLGLPAAFSQPGANLLAEPCAEIQKTEERA